MFDFIVSVNYKDIKAQYKRPSGVVLLAGTFVNRY